MAFKKPVVMLIGRADNTGEGATKVYRAPGTTTIHNGLNQQLWYAGAFEPFTSYRTDRSEPATPAYINILMALVDVTKAVASVDADRVREIEKVKQQPGGAEAVNFLCKGALMGAFECMEHQDILAGAMGNMAPLRALETKEAREDAMRRAAAAGFKDIVLELIALGADVHGRRPRDGDLALLAASWAGHLSVVQALISKGANVNATRVDGSTAMHIAAMVAGGNLPIMQTLLDNSADIHMADFSSGLTPLHIAAMKGCLPAVEWLLTAGARVNTVTKQGHTAAQYARHFGFRRVEDLLNAQQ